MFFTLGFAPQLCMRHARERSRALRSSAIDADVTEHSLAAVTKTNSKQPANYFCYIRDERLRAFYAIDFLLMCYNS